MPGVGPQGPHPGYPSPGAVFYSQRDLGPAVPLGPRVRPWGGRDPAEVAQKHRDYEALSLIIKQWNANRLDLFALSTPNEVRSLKKDILKFGISNKNPEGF